jgi:hypothetical protein
VGVLPSAPARAASREEAGGAWGLGSGLEATSTSTCTLGCGASPGTTGGSRIVGGALLETGALFDSGALIETEGLLATGALLEAGGGTTGADTGATVASSARPKPHEAHDAVPRTA